MSLILPLKPKRVPPPDAADQLRVGRPPDTLVNQIWRISFQSPDSLEPYRPDWEPVNLIRQISSAIEEFVRHCSRHPDPIIVVKDAQGKLGFSAQPACKKFLELFCNSPENKIAAITRHFPQHRFHPLFDIYRNIATQSHNHEARNIIKFAADYLFFRRDRLDLDFSSRSEMQIFCDQFNLFSKTLCKETKKINEKIKSFRRTAQETRYSLMQYAEHLIARAPKPFIAHIAIYRPSYSHEREIMSHNEISAVRSRFIRMIKTEIPEDIYLGYSVLLRHNAQIGFWLDTFVFLRDDDVLRWASTSLDNFLHIWKAHVSENHAVYVGHGWPAAPGYGKTLAETTMATEFDFYCRVTPPNGNRGFWCSQSPVGKLAKRTKIRKQSAAKVGDKDPSLSSDPLLRSTQQEEQLEIAALRLSRWEQQTENHQRTLSKKRTKAAKIGS